ncbi:hypothetical protein DM860_016403 [Cuscuta australis]|uniref:Uncharacterized protein n=1 Tax=Cuscuta australis TaxID=267555 RepID=A0A328DEI6_9ASTE|nr:hypothetical protein DM860_016403 [Cuscuta australis]
MAKHSPTAFCALICLILATGALSCELFRSPLASLQAGDVNATSHDEIMAHTDYHYRCMGNFGPCDNHCDEACCFRLCRSSYSDLNPCPICSPYGSLKFCLCYHDCYN